MKVINYYDTIPQDVVIESEKPGAIALACFPKATDLTP